jgi:DNA-binding response OmpR family regulator
VLFYVEWSGAFLLIRIKARYLYDMMRRYMSKRVLVVDDSEIVLEMAGEALKAKGYEVATALNARDADRFIYGDRRPDVIIIDVMMPSLDGDVKTRMLKDDPATKGIPVLLLSSKSEAELVRLSSESGADGYIRKPFTFKEMIERIEAVTA